MKDVLPLIGVVLGGLLTGGVQFVGGLFARRRRRQVAIRLVYDELLRSKATMGMIARIAKDEGDPSRAATILHSARWAEFAPDLADTLPKEDWLRVSFACGLIVDMAPLLQGGSLAESAEPTRERLEQGIAALGPHLR